MPDETAHGLDVRQSCNLCEGLVCPSRIRRVCLQIHLDQSLVTALYIQVVRQAMTQTASRTRTHLQVVICKEQISIQTTDLGLLYKIKPLS